MKVDPRRRRPRWRPKTGRRGQTPRGAPLEILSRYAAAGVESGSSVCSHAQHPGRRGHCVPTMKRVELRTDGGRPSSVIRMGAALEVHVSYEIDRPLRPVLGAIVKSNYGAPIFCVSDRFCDQLIACNPVARGTVVCAIEKTPLMPGSYWIDLYLGDANGDVDVIHDAISFEVSPADVTGSGRLPPASAGPIFCDATWSLLDDQCGKSEQ